MMKRTLFPVLLFGLLGNAPGTATPLNAAERVFCDGDACSPDVLAVRFGDPSERTSRLRANLGDEFPVSITVDVSSTTIQGWSIALRHDPEKLEILEVSVEGLGIPDDFLVYASLAAGEPHPGFVAGGLFDFNKAVDLFLPVRPNLALVRARYRVIGELDPLEPTVIEFVDNVLQPVAGPRASNDFVIDGQIRPPERVIVGQIVKGVDDPVDMPFRRGDCNGDGVVNFADAVICADKVLGGDLARFDCDNMFDANDNGLIDSGDPILIIDYFMGDQPALADPFTECANDDDSDLLCAESNCLCDNYAFYFGNDPTAETHEISGNSFTVSMRHIIDVLGFSVAIQRDGGDYTFADGVFGVDDDRKVELYMVDEDGNVIRPDRVNSATGPDREILSVSRGEAIDGFPAGSDFFAWDVLGEGTGVVVEYAVDFFEDTDSTIPPPGTDATGCLVSEILKIGLPGEGGCDDWSIAFGEDPTVETFEITGDSFPISLRNAKDALGFSFGVQVEGSNYTFADKTLGANPDRPLIENIITDIDAVEHVPTTNAATGPSLSERMIAGIELGPALQALGGDFLVVDLDPVVGGPGFTVAYGIDPSQAGEGVIPATVVDTPCPANQVLRVSFEGEPGECTDDYGYYFGTDSTVENFEISGDSFKISTRNAREVIGFSLGVKTDAGNYTFVDRVLGELEGREVDLVISDDEGSQHVLPGVGQGGPGKLVPDLNINTASGPDRPIVAIEPGTAISTPDNLFVDLDPVVGGPGFTALYVPDLAGTENLLPATPTNEACPVNEILVVSFEGQVGECTDDYGFYFGEDSTVDNLDIMGDSFKISMRNAREVIGFSLGVKTDAGSYSFADRVLGELEGREVDLVISDDEGSQHVLPGAGQGGPGKLVPDLNINTASGPDRQIGSIDPGTAIAAPANLFVDLDPRVGGPGFTALYVPDVTGTGDLLPVTPKDEACPVNEILIVNFGTPARPFSRGDCNGNGRLNVTDAALCAQNIFLADLRPELVLFDCQKMLDANNDGLLDTADPIAILTWVFLNGPDLDAPFLSCGVEDEGDEDTLTCNVSNCE